MKLEARSISLTLTNDEMMEALTLFLQEEQGCPENFEELTIDDIESDHAGITFELVT